MALYCATRHEDQPTLVNKRLDALTEHMVLRKTNNLEAITAISEGLLIWEMSPRSNGYFYFGETLNSPEA